MLSVKIEDQQTQLVQFDTESAVMDLYKGLDMDSLTEITEVLEAVVNALKLYRKDLVSGQEDLDMP
ncbi:hypothetical protein [Desertivirga arenae]|uniref:hypothetical protein n=1 Tax=Desertivirga arenae TaxID=2810309 RepID=UPI001A96DF58|nr:hypothetical protein [Pedobacter sp. SYSU D00823]